MKVFLFKATTTLLVLVSLFPSNVNAEFDHSYPLWAKILSRSLVESKPTNLVRYKELKESPVELDQFISQIEALSREEYNSFSEVEKIAFLINSYNALTVKLIVKNYPIGSIKQVTSLFASPWKLDFFSLFGEKRNLDYIEHEMLRKDFREPRIHFAIVCAARSCPPLQSTPFLPSSLDQQLEQAAQEFLRNPKRNFFDVKESRLMLSKIFSWFKEDFEKSGGTIKDFVAFRISDSKNVQSQILNERVKIDYFDYDWDLNDAIS